MNFLDDLEVPPYRTAPMMVHKQRFVILPKCEQFVYIDVLGRIHVLGPLEFDSIVRVEEYEVGIS